MELTGDKENHADEEDDVEDMIDDSKANGDSDMDPENESEEEQYIIRLQVSKRTFTFIYDLILVFIILDFNVTK